VHKTEVRDIASCIVPLGRLGRRNKIGDVCEGICAMSQTNPIRRRYVSVQEAADYLKVTDRTIRAMIADGRLTGYRNGGRLVRLDLNEIDAAMEPFGANA